jgi:hypothetical protein
MQHGSQASHLTHVFVPPLLLCNRDAKAFSRTMHPDKARLACAYTHLTAKHTATPVFDRPWRRERISANLSKTCGWVYGKLNVSVTDDPLAADPSADDPATAGVVLSLT